MTFDEVRGLRLDEFVALSTFMTKYHEAQKPDG